MFDVSQLTPKQKQALDLLQREVNSDLGNVASIASITKTLLKLSAQASKNAQISQMEHLTEAVSLLRLLTANRTRINDALVELIPELKG